MSNPAFNGHSDQMIRVMVQDLRRNDTGFEFDIRGPKAVANVRWETGTGIPEPLLIGHALALATVEAWKCHSKDNKQTQATAALNVFLVHFGDRTDPEIRRDAELMAAFEKVHEFCTRQVRRM